MNSLAEIVVHTFYITIAKSIKYPQISKKWLIKSKFGQKKIGNTYLRLERILINNPQLSRIPPPGCVWAQRPKHIILSICLTDVKDPVIKVEKNKLYFKGVGGSEMKEHEVDMELFKEIDVEVGINFNFE